MCIMMRSVFFETNQPGAQSNTAIPYFLKRTYTALEAPHFKNVRLHSPCRDQTTFVL